MRSLCLIIIAVIANPAIAKIATDESSTGKRMDREYQFRFKGTRGCRNNYVKECDVIRALQEKNETGAIMLINEGIYANMLDWNKATAMHYAAEYEYIDLMNLLIEKGYKYQINEGDCLGETPLYSALKCIPNKGSKNRTIKLLLDNGVDPNVKIFGVTFRDWMRVSEEYEILHLLDVAAYENGSKSQLSSDSMSVKEKEKFLQIAEANVFVRTLLCGKMPQKCKSEEDLNE